MKNAYLIGEKVYLRPLEPADARTMVPWMNDFDVTRTLQAFRPSSEADELAFIERVTKSDRDVAAAIMTRRGDRFIGTTGLHRISWRERHACFGIAIGDKAAWGKGYGTEATRLITGCAFERLNLNRVWLHVYAFNAAGIRAYERVGYQREGVLRQAVFVDGAYHDVHLMAMLREEWDAAARTKRTPARRAAARRTPRTSR